MEVKKSNKAVVDLALTQTFLFYYVNHVVLMLNSIFLSKICIGKQRGLSLWLIDGVIRCKGVPLHFELVFPLFANSS